jgi:uncharacterized protein
VGEMMIDKNTGMVLLFDCYQPLLTDKQRQMMDLYYNQDFSLAEIAEELGISRQGVYDHLKRTGRLLILYENKMGLLETFQRQSRLIRNMKEAVARIEQQFTEQPQLKDTQDHLKLIKESLEQLYQISTT